MSLNPDSSAQVKVIISLKIKKKHAFAIGFQQYYCVPN